MSLLHSLRAFKLSVPFTFDYDSKGFDRSVWSKIEQSVSEPKIHFIASTDFENVDFFQNITRNDSDYDFSNLQVYINGELTKQVANSISANANDDIVIKSTNGKYPWFGRYLNNNIYSIDYIKSIEEPFPLMYQVNGKEITSFNYCFNGCSSLTNIPEGLFDNNPQVTSFNYCFNGCSSLTNIPEGLFDNNPQVTNFSDCFRYCSSLTNIPEGLFDNNPQVTNFSSCFQNCTSLTNIPIGLFDNNPQVTNFGACFWGCSSLTNIPKGLFDNCVNVTNFINCFGYCTSLTSIPVGLFDKNTQVTNFSYCFSTCSNLTVNVQIGSIASSVNVTNFARNTKEKGTVYCKEGSGAYTAFSESTNANVNVLTY